MKYLLIWSIFFFSQDVKWLDDYQSAKIEAADTHKSILIYFSGSDWCGPCIRERKEILESAVFKDFAIKNLVLVKADFPRDKKNQLSKDQVKRNEALADVFNRDGKFPLTLLLDAGGKVIKVWDGLPKETAENFVGDLNVFTRGSK